MFAFTKTLNTKHQRVLKVRSTYLLEELEK